MSHENAPNQGSYEMDMSSIAAVTFLVWDILITFDQEVNAVWSKPNRVYSKWLFFFVRYFAVAMQVSLLFVGTQFALSFHYTESDCVKWYVFQEVGTQLLIASVEVILIIRVHALYDRNRYLTLMLIVFFLAENIVMTITLIRVVPGVSFDATCTVIHSPSSLVFFAVAFVSFETILFALTLVKFLAALRDGWGRTSVVYLLVRDGTWAFMLIFVTLCVNAGFYLGAGDSAIAAIAFPWLLSIESFAGARIVLNLHAVSPNPPADGFGTSGLGGTLPSHMIFTTHSSVGNRPRTPSVRWDWEGLQKYSNDNRIGHANGSRSGESYEMTWTTTASGTSSHEHSHKDNTTSTNPTSPDTWSGTCVDAEQDVV